MQTLTLTRRQLLRIAALGSGAALAAPMAGCEQRPAATASETPASNRPAQRSGEEYVWLSANANLPLFTRHDHPALRLAGEELGVKVSVAGPNSVDIPGLVAAIDDPDAIVLVGTIDGTPIGYAVARLDVMADGAGLVVIDDLFTEPEGRAVGVGEAMLDAVIAWGTERGAVGLDAVVLPGNRDTKNFFESFGLKARALVVHRELP